MSDLPRPIPESYWVRPGQLLAGEYPGRNSDTATRQIMEVFLGQGFDTFINLTTEAELPPYQPILLEQALHRNLRISPALPHRRLWPAYPIADDRHPKRHRLGAGRRPQSVRPLLGRDRAHGHDRRLLSRPTGTERRAGARSACGMVAVCTQKHLPSPLARNRFTSAFHLELERITNPGGNP